MSERPPTGDLIYDWNTAGNGYPHRSAPVEFDDETLRDGLQSPSVRDPASGILANHERPGQSVVRALSRRARGGQYQKQRRPNHCPDCREHQHSGPRRQPGVRGPAGLRIEHVRPRNLRLEREHRVEDPGYRADRDAQGNDCPDEGSTQTQVSAGHRGPNLKRQRPLPGQGPETGPADRRVHDVEQYEHRKHHGQSRQVCLIWRDRRQCERRGLQLPLGPRVDAQNSNRNGKHPEAELEDAEDQTVDQPGTQARTHAGDPQAGRQSALYWGHRPRRTGHAPHPRGVGACGSSVEPPDGRPVGGARGPVTRPLISPTSR